MGQCKSSELLLYLDLYLEGLLWQRSRASPLLRTRPTCIPRNKLALFSISKVVDCQLPIRHVTDTRTSNAVRNAHQESCNDRASCLLQSEPTGCSALCAQLPAAISVRVYLVTPRETHLRFSIIVSLSRTNFAHGIRSIRRPSNSFWM